MTTDGRRILSDELIMLALARRTPAQAPADLLEQVVRATDRVPQTTPRSIPWPRVARRRALLLVAAMILLALAAWIVGQQRRTPEPSGGLAYIRDGDVYVARSNGTNPVMLLDDVAVDFTRVTVLDDHQLAVEGAGVITIVDPATGARRRGGLTGETTTWLPGGHEYAYVSRTAEGTPVTVIVDLGTGSSRRLLDVVLAGERSWSPDGRWLASRLDDGSVVIVDAATGVAKATILSASDNPPEIPDIAWSPDSSTVSLVALVPGVCNEGNAEPTTGAGATSAPFQCAEGHTQVLVASVAGAPRSGTAEAITGDISDAPSQYKVGPGMAIAWSPDGTWIAYRARSGLSIVRPDGSEGRALVASPIGWFAWAADSSGLGFVATTTPDDATGDLSWIGLADPAPRSLHIDGVGEVASIGLPASSVTATAPQSPAAAGTVATIVVTPAPAPDADPSENWRGLVFVDYPDSCEQVRQLDFGSDSGPHAVTDCAGQARVSPDGAHAAVGRRRFHSTSSEDSLAIIDLRTGVKTRIETGGSEDMEFDWSPGGRWLAWPGGITDLEGRGTIDLPSSADRHALPVWSPDDSRVSVAASEGSLVGDGSGANLRSLGTFPQASSWSYDGSRLVFLRDGDAWVADADGTDVRNLTGFEFGGVGQMALSPDGGTLAVVQGGSTLWLIELDGTRQQVDLGADVALEDARLSWSPGGTRVAVDIGESIATYLVSADGSGAVRLDYASNPTWSPDGRYLAVLTSHDRVGAIDIANADGSGRVTVTATPVEVVSHLAWVGRP